MEQVYSVTINGLNDCVVMTQEQSLMVQLKYSPNIEIHNMTERHGILPQHLHKLQRYESAHLTHIGHPQLVVKGTHIGIFGAAGWSFEDLMKGVDTEKG